MPVIRSRIDTSSRSFADNQAHMQSLVNDLKARLERVAQGGVVRIAQLQSKGYIYLRP